MGTSGSGKTTSLRNLPFSETFYIDADGKGLSWKGWRNQYNATNKNYFRCDDPDTINSLLDTINEKQPQVKYVIIDTLNGIMVGDEMRRSKEKGYDKWMDLASSIYNIVDKSNKLREDLTIIMLAHTQTSDDGFTCMLTNGRKLNKIVLESKLTTVILAREKDGKYIFELKSHNNTVKTPMGAFDVEECDNDIMIVINALSEF